MRDIPEEFRLAKDERFQQYPWVWLVETSVPTTPIKPLRICNYTKVVEFDADNTGIPQKFYPAPFSFGDVRIDTEGSLPSLPLTIGNVTREVLAILLNNDYLVGRDAKLTLVNAASLDNADAKMEFPVQIRSASENNSTITFNLSSFALNNVTAPQFRVSRTGCWHNYGDDGCGFDIAGLDPGQATLGACGKTIPECEARGALEVADGRPQDHPKRIGLFPGLPLAGQ